jgi:hypothetical protein
LPFPPTHGSRPGCPRRSPFTLAGLVTIPGLVQHKSGSSVSQFGLAATPFPPICGSCAGVTPPIPHSLTRLSSPFRRVATSGGPVGFLVGPCGLPFSPTHGLRTGCPVHSPLTGLLSQVRPDTHVAMRPNAAGFPVGPLRLPFRPAYGYCTGYPVAHRCTLLFCSGGLRCDMKLLYENSLSLTMPSQAQVPTALL